MSRYYILLIAVFLQGCLESNTIVEEPEQPSKWTRNLNEDIAEIDVSDLKSWWEKFNDPVLNDLITLALNNSPDRKIAESRINKVRGIQRTQRSYLFPQVDVLSKTGREDTGTKIDNYYDLRFDASYELDVFGENKKRVKSADLDIEAAEEDYKDISLTLIGDVARTYLRVREFQKQIVIAKNNLKLQEETLALIRNQFSVGEATQLDLDRAENLVNTTTASIPEFERRAINAQLQLTVLTGVLPEHLKDYITMQNNIPSGDIKAVLLSPTQVLMYRPDIRAAISRLKSSTAISEAESASIFPDFNLGAFYGVAESALISPATIWGVLLGGAFALLDFGRIEGKIDVAKADQMQALQEYRKRILNAVTEVETALNDYSKISNRRVSLDKAYINAEKAMQLSTQLFKEGEISFIDVLDSQRTVNQSDSELVTAQAAQSESLIRLYKSLGVY
jgi:NodT family efflux transporter outer membrane factor (OMF) lipoprotein